MEKLRVPLLVTLTLTLLTSRESCCTRLQNAPPAMLTTAGLMASSSQLPPDPYDLVPPIDDPWDEAYPPTLRKRPWALPDPLHCCLLRLSCCRRRAPANYS